MANILVVEDDIIINQVICEFLKENKYNVVPVFDGQIALEKFNSETFDLIILDIMIPSISGIELLKEIRKNSDVPIMMLTAINDEYTQLISFNNMISDYVVKPFSPTILVKRVENILRNTTKENNIILNDIIIKVNEGTVLHNKNEVILTKKEYDILVYLAKKTGKIVPREQLMSAIWGYDDSYSRVLDNHMKNLRKKLPSLPLKTIVGRGYQIEEI
ncbi:MAG: response regulator transcription factor [Erysipelotrichaceae bacterium]|nr:response regulator transcription factor [Erysipelotrichaceae bacterium]